MMQCHFSKSLPSEKTITQQEAQRAIYLDFEGLVKEAPAMAGYSIDGHFQQVVLDSSLKSAGTAKGMAYIEGKAFVSMLIDIAKTENRRIVAFSVAEKELCFRWYQLDLSQYYVNANILAKRWKRTQPKLKSQTKLGLKDYLAYLKYPMPKDQATQQAAARIRHVKDMCNKRGAFKQITRVAKSKWTKLLKYNQVDVQGMAMLVNETLIRQ